MNCRHWRTLFLILVTLLSSQSAPAATVTVEIFNFFFEPAQVTINPGDTVTWIQRGSNHNSESDQGLWNGPILDPGQTYSRAFPTAGTFPYHCTPHPFMKGTVIVQGAANPPPAASITQPSSGSSFSASASVTIAASASDSNGSVTQVEFFDGATSLGVDSSSPFSISVTLAVGSHSLTAKATDNEGASTTSAAVQVTVNAPNNPPSVALSGPINGATFTAGAAVAITATAADSDGSVSQVEFFDGSTSLGVDASSPFSVNASLAVGTHVLTARATDNSGAQTTSASVTITVNAPNVPPNVAVTSPVGGTTFTAGASITVSATATDSDGTVTQVEFFDGATSLGVDTSAPYTISTTLVVGNHTLTAKATDNAGAATTSVAVNVTVSAPNSAPTVAVTNPTGTSTLTAPASITIEVAASDADGTVAQVEFFDGTTALGIDTTSPFALSVVLLAGTHSLTAKATDSSGASTVSAAVTVTVKAPNTPPVVTIASPTNGAAFIVPATVTIDASASDSDGTVTQVEFFAGTTLLGSDTNSPFSLSATLPVGTHVLTAKATDNDGASTVSTAVTIVIAPANVPPSVAITGPPSGTTVEAAAALTISATANDSDGSITQVEFFDGAVSLGVDATSPFSVSARFAAGTHLLTAKATDNSGAVTVSAAVTVTVTLPNVAPTVLISSPTNGTVFQAGTAVAIQTDAADSDGKVAKVEFFSDGNLLATVSAAPFVFSVTNLTVGSHSLTATATDDSGAQTTSSAVAITINAPAVAASLSGASRLGNGQFQFTLKGTSGQSYVIQASVNLVDWVSIQTNTMSGASANVVDADAAGVARRFYRVVQQ